MSQNRPSKADIVPVVVGFFLIAVAMRLVPHEYNFTAMGALGLFVGYYWSARIGILVSLAAMSVSDLVGQWLGIPSMGAYSVALMLTVYAAMAASALIGKVLTFERLRRIPLFCKVPGGAILATIVFFLVTNFASWLDPMTGYEMSLFGLLQSYWLALPFAVNDLAGNLFFSVAFFAAYEGILAPQLRTAKQTIES